MYRSSLQKNGSVLIKVTTSLQPDPQLLQHLDHEFALADLLDSGWALHPNLQARIPEGEALVYDDFDGQPLDVSSLPFDVDAFLDCAIKIVSVVVTSS